MPVDDDGALAPVRATRAVAVAAVIALVALGLAWELWLAPTGARSLALKVVPLAWLLPGLSKLRLRTYRAMCLLVWLYVAEGALRWVSDTGLAARLAAFELALCGLLFVACVAHIRARTRREATPA